MLPLTAPDCIESTMSAPLGSTSSPLVSYPARENQRRQAWRFIAPRPHALRLVSKQQWSGTLGHALATARARYKSRQSLGDRRAIRWQWRLTRHPSPQTRFLQVPHSSWHLLGGVYSYLLLQRCPLLHAASSELCPQQQTLLGGTCVEQLCRFYCPARCKLPAKPMGHAPLQTGAAHAKTAER